MMKGQIAALCLALSALPVAAEGFYAFADLGTSEYELSADGATDSDDDTALGLGAGYSFNSYIAAELAYRSFGSISDVEDGVGGEIEASALQLSALGSVPLNEQFSLLGRLGLARMNADFDIAYYGDSLSLSDSTTNLFFGVGARYAFTEQFALRAEYNQYAGWDDVFAPGLDLTMSALVIGAELHF